MATSYDTTAARSIWSVEVFARTDFNEEPLQARSPATSAELSICTVTIVLRKTLRDNLLRNNLRATTPASLLIFYPAEISCTCLPIFNLANNFAPLIRSPLTESIYDRAMYYLLLLSFQQTSSLLVFEFPGACTITVAPCCLFCSPVPSSADSYNMLHAKEATHEHTGTAAAAPYTL